MTIGRGGSYNMLKEDREMTKNLNEHFACLFNR